MMNIADSNRKKQILCYCAFAAYLLFMHFRFLPGDCDDGWFAKALDTCDIWEYLGRRYEGWTSRLLPELLIVYLTRCSPWVWKVLDIFFVLLLIYGSVCVFAKQGHYLHTAVFMLLFLLIPPNMLHSSGWITQSVNYTWTIAAGVYALIPLRRYVDKKEPEQKSGLRQVFFRFSYMAACFYACFQEQTAAVLLVVYLLFIGCRLYRREKVPVLWYVMLGIIALMLLFILTCPGNEWRCISETQKWFPRYALLSFGEKLLIGFLQTFSFYVSAEGYNMIFLTFAGILFLSVCAVQKGFAKRTIAAFPLGAAMIWGLLGRIIADSGMTSRTYWMKLVQNSRLPAFGVYENKHIIVECCIFLFILCAVLYSLYQIFGKTGWFVIAFLVLSASLCTRIIIGFSPTVYASLSRPALIGCVGFLVLAFLCFQEAVERTRSRTYLTCVSVWYLFGLAVTLCIGSFTETF